MPPRRQGKMGHCLERQNYYFSAQTAVPILDYVTPYCSKQMDAANNRHWQRISFQQVFDTFFKSTIGQT
jgi:hypothetical protein